MPIVQAALGRYLAAATVSAPSLLPIPEVLVICGGENKFSLQIEGLPKFVLPIFDPVFPYAIDVSADVEVAVAYA